MERNRNREADFRAPGSLENRPVWLSQMMALPRSQFERGGNTFSTIDAIGASAPIERVRKGLNGHGKRAQTLFEKAIERRDMGVDSNGFHQEIIEHPVSGIPPIIAVQDRDPNPNSRVRAYYSTIEGVHILRAVSGVDRKDERVILDVFKAEGYRMDTKALSTNSTRE